jgi:hypothetical protein
MLHEEPDGNHLDYFLCLLTCITQLTVAWRAETGVIRATRNNDDSEYIFKILCHVFERNGNEKHPATTFFWGNVQNIWPH